MTTKKKPSLAAAMQAVNTRQAQPVPLAVESESAPAVPASRVGKKVIAGHFDPAVARQLKQLALDRDTTVQNLLAEALNDLFEKHQMQPIA